MMLELMRIEVGPPAEGKTVLSQFSLSMLRSGFLSRQTSVCLGSTSGSHDLPSELALSQLSSQNFTVSSIPVLFDD